MGRCQTGRHASAGEGCCRCVVFLQIWGASVCIKELISHAFESFAAKSLLFSRV